MSKFANPVCSYCGSKMTLTMVAIKRKVPPGAKDLGISDEMMCWKCQKCEQTSREGINVCGICSKETLDVGGPELSTITNVPIKLIETRYWVSGHGISDGYTAGCTACAKCSICKLPLASRDFKKTEKEEKAANGETITWHYSYSHSKCIEDERRRKEEAHEQWKRQKQLKEQEEKERQYRIREALCVTCGRALTFLDKFANRQKHKACA